MRAVSSILGVSGSSRVLSGLLLLLAARAAVGASKASEQFESTARVRARLVSLALTLAER